MSPIQRPSLQDRLRPASLHHIRTCHLISGYPSRLNACAVQSTVNISHPVNEMSIFMRLPISIVIESHIGALPMVQWLAV